MEALKARLYCQLEPTAWPGDGISLVNKVVLVLVSLSVLVAIFETEPYIRTNSPDVFPALKIFLAVVFTIEYLLRLWTAGILPKYTGLRGK